MAAISTTRPAASASVGRLTHFASDVLATLRTWNDARQTRNALNKLSNRELDDIGLIRGDIDNVSRRATF